MPYIGTVAYDGYLPDSDTPPQIWPTAASAWQYLANEQANWEDMNDEPGDSYSSTVLELEERAGRVDPAGIPLDHEGTVWQGSLAFSVTYVPDSMLDAGPDDADWDPQCHCGHDECGAC